MRKLSRVLALAVVLLCPSLGQTPAERHTVARLEEYLQNIESAGFFGSVLVEMNGEKVLSRGYGFRDKGRLLKNTPATVFDIGSITKQFTAAAILKLEMQGKLQVGDRLSQYFDSVPADKASITLHDLLRHQSGLQGDVGRDYDRISRTDFVDSVMRSPLRFEPVTRFSYSNIGYSLLALIVETVSGMTYENFLYEYLWRPAGMEMTGYTRPAFDPATIAVGYRRNEEPWGRPTEKEWDDTAPFWHLQGNGGVLSTIEDLRKWHQALLTDGILSGEALKKLYFPALRPDENDNPYYAYGWDVVKTKRNTLLVWHNGSNGIFYADFHRYLDDRVTIIMLSNRSHPHFNGLNREIAKIIFEVDYRPEIPIADNEANRAYTETILAAVLEKGIEAAKTVFTGRSTGLGILEYVLNRKGYDLLSQQKHDQAIAVFTMNTFAFPQSANAFDSLAEGYKEAANKELALRYYRKSLELDPGNTNAEEMIAELEKEK